MPLSRTLGIAVAMASGLAAQERIVGSVASELTAPPIPLMTRPFQAATTEERRMLEPRLASSANVFLGTLQGQPAAVVETLGDRIELYLDLAATASGARMSAPC